MNRHRYAQRRFTFAPSQDRNSLQSPQSIRVLTVSRLDHHASLPHQPHLLHKREAHQDDDTTALALTADCEWKRDSRYRQIYDNNRLLIAIEPGLVAVGGARWGSGSESISDRKTGAGLALGFPELIAAVLKTQRSAATAASKLGPRPSLGSERPHRQPPGQAEPTVAPRGTVHTKSPAAAEL